MKNEILLIITLFVEYSLVVIAYKYFGKVGLYAWMALATVLANIEVLILVDAYGIEMTLGNILFATTFLVTDILSEVHGKEAAKKGVSIGIASSVLFMIISASWLMYIPSKNNVTTEAFKGLFGYTPRIVISSLVVFVLVQYLDVWLYHKVWKVTTKGYSRKSLWMRNNCATITSQIINAILYNLLAFGGIYPKDTIVSIIIATVAIYIVTSIADTPFIYLARKIGS